MTDLTLTAYVWLQTKLHSLRVAVEERAENEAGLETVEVVALIGAMLVLIGAISKAFEAEGDKVGEAAVNKLAEWIAGLGSK